MNFYITTSQRYNIKKINHYPYGEINVKVYHQKDKSLLHEGPPSKR